MLQADVDEALAGKAAGERLGEYLVRHGKLSEAEFYMALSLQQNLPLAAPRCFGDLRRGHARGARRGGETLAGAAIPGGRGTVIRGGAGVAVATR